MLKLSRRSEYALMAVQHIAGSHRRVSVASMAQSEQIPQPLLAKVMQRLKKAGVARSTKGVGGGYELARPLSNIMFLDVISPFEEQIGLVDCAGHTKSGCDRSDCCSLRDPITTLNTFLMAQLTHLTMAEFIAMSAPKEQRALQSCVATIGAPHAR